jgi:putative membrane protein
MSIRKLRGSSLLVGAALCVALTASASARTHRGASKTSEQQFMTEAIQGDLAEVKMGKLAQEKGQSDRVKEFGKMLEQDHSEHLQKAQQLAGQQI